MIITVIIVMITTISIIMIISIMMMNTIMVMMPLPQEITSVIFDSIDVKSHT